MLLFALVTACLATKHQEGVEAHVQRTFLRTQQLLGKPTEHLEPQVRRRQQIQKLQSALGVYRKGLQTADGSRNPASLATADGAHREARSNAVEQLREVIARLADSRLQQMAGV